MMKKLILIPFLFLLLLASPAWAATYHVTATGAGAKTGADLANAWDLAQANAGLTAGDTAQLYDNDGAFTTTRIAPANVGTSGNVITYEAATGETPVFTNNVGCYPTNYNVIGGITFTNCGYAIIGNGDTNVEVKNCTFSGSSSWATISLDDCDYWSIHDNGFGSKGATIDGTSLSISQDSDYNLVYDNTFTDCAAHTCLEFFRTNNVDTVPEYNVIRGNTFSDTGAKAGVTYDVDSFIMIIGADNNLIEENTFYESGADVGNNKTAAMKISASGNKNIIRKNTAYNVDEFFFQAYVSSYYQNSNVQDVQYNQVYHNTCYNTMYDMSEGGHGVFHLYALSSEAYGTLEYNRIMNNLIDSINGSGNYDLYFLSEHESDVAWTTIGTNNEFLNNIAYDRGDQATYDVWRKLTSTEQLSMSSAESSYPSEFAGNLVVDPQMTDPANQDFTLQSGSPAIDSAVYPAKITAVNGNVLTFQKGEAYAFYDGFGITGETADTAYSSDGSTSSVLTDIDYANDTITVTSSTGFDVDEYVTPINFYGTAPDIGANERASDPPNQRPNGVIDTPADGSCYDTAAEVSFTGTGTDPESDAITYLWNSDIDGDFSTDEDPGASQLISTGTHTITLTVSDAGGADPTPHVITVQVANCPTGNDFSGDASADWKFEDGALTTDSIGTNTLTNNNAVTADAVNYWEGAASAFFTDTDSEYFSITDANLDAGFPLSNGEGGDFTILGWIKMGVSDEHKPIFAKLGATNKSILIRYDATNAFSCWMSSATDGGATLDMNVVHGTPMTDGKPYFYAFAFENSTYTYRIRIWDEDGSTILGTDATGTLGDAINIEDAPLYIGGDGSVYWDGNIDGVRVFPRKLSADEIDAVRSEQFPVASAQEIYAISNNGSYGEGQTVDIGVRYDKPVIVDTGGGVPFWPGETGDDDLQFSYLVGSGTTVLIYRSAAIQAGMTTNGNPLTIAAAGFQLNGGTIKYGSPAIDTVNTTPSSPDRLQDNSAIVIDTTAPTITAFEHWDIVNGIQQANETTYTTGEYVYFRLTGSENFACDGPWTNITQTFTCKPSNKTAEFYSVAADKMIIRFLVNAGEWISNLIATGTDALSDGDSTLHDASPAENVFVLTLPQVDPTGGNIIIASPCAYYWTLDTGGQGIAITGGSIQ